MEDFASYNEDELEQKLQDGFESLKLEPNQEALEREISRLREEIELAKEYEDDYEADEERLQRGEALLALVEASDRSRRAARELEVRRRIEQLRALIHETLARAPSNLSVRFDRLDGDMAKKREGIEKFTQIGRPTKKLESDLAILREMHEHVTELKELVPVDFNWNSLYLDGEPPKSVPSSPMPNKSMPASLPSTPSITTPSIPSTELGLQVSVDSETLYVETERPPELILKKTLSVPLESVSGSKGASKDLASDGQQLTPVKRADSDKRESGSDESLTPTTLKRSSNNSSTSANASSNRNSNSNASARLRVFPHLGNPDMLELVNAEFINANRTKSPSELFNIGLNHELGIGVGIKHDLREAYKYFHLAASLHSSDALYRLGLMYETGTQYTPLNMDLAFQYYQQAARQGNADALYTLGLKYENGIGIEKDLQSSVQYYKLASKNGHSQASFNLGLIFEKGTLQNKEESIYYYEMASRQGNVDADLNLGLIYYYGNGVKKDKRKAFELISRSKDKGNECASLVIDSLDFERANNTGDATEETQPLPLSDKEDSQENPPPTTYCRLLEIMEDNFLREINWNIKDNNFYPDINAEVVPFFDDETRDSTYDSFHITETTTAAISTNSGASIEPASERKLSNSLPSATTTQTQSAASTQIALPTFNLMDIAKSDRTKLAELELTDADGRVKDAAFLLKALTECYKEATLADKHLAQYKLGTMFEYGIGVAKDISQALIFYQKSSDHGNPDAQFSLGLLYECGKEDCEQNEEKAFKYFEAAAVKGKSASQFNLGCMYHNGIGVAQSTPQALHYYNLAAQQNNPDALNCLGDIYSIGDGVEANLDKAFHYYKLAAKKGKIEGNYSVGLMCESGVGVDINKRKAFKHFQIAAKQGHACALFKLGEFYRHGCDGVVERSLEQAKQYYEQSAALNNADAIHALSHLNQASLATSVVANSTTASNKGLSPSQSISNSKEGNSKEATTIATTATTTGNSNNTSPKEASATNASTNNTNNNLRLRMPTPPTMQIPTIHSAPVNASPVPLSPTSKDINFVSELDTLEKKSKVSLSIRQFNLAQMYEKGSVLGKNVVEAVKYYKLAAELGNSDAVAALDFLYEKQEREMPGASSVFKQFSDLLFLADRGNAKAQYNVGSMYQHGKGVAKNLKEAAVYYRLAAQQSNPNAQYSLALLYESGEGGLAQSPEEAFKYFKLAADNGLASAQYRCGECYYENKGVVNGEIAEAQRYFQLAATQGNVEAYYYLGLCHETNYEFEQAFANYKTAAEKGRNTRAQFKVGFMYERGLGIFKNFQEAKRFYKMSAAESNSDAQVHLGILYEQGEAVKRDVKEAVKYYKLSSAQGNGKAYYRLGLLYEHGSQGYIKKNMKEAVKMYKHAITHESHEGYYALACLYENGNGVTKDLGKAFDYYHMAADYGNESAQYYLGIQYKTGVPNFIEQDYGKAAHYISLSASSGHCESQFYLAMLYQAGLGVPIDYEKASHYYLLAANQGLSDAQILYDQVVMLIEENNFKREIEDNFAWCDLSLDESYSSDQREIIDFETMIQMVEEIEALKSRDSCSEYEEDDLFVKEEMQNECEFENKDLVNKVHLTVEIERVGTVRRLSEKKLQKERDELLKNVGVFVRTDSTTPNSDSCVEKQSTEPVVPPTTTSATTPMKGFVASDGKLPKLSGSSDLPALVENNNNNNIRSAISQALDASDSDEESFGSQTCLNASSSTLSHAHSSEEMSARASAKKKSQSRSSPAISLDSTDADMKNLLKEMSKEMSHLQQLNADSDVIINAIDMGERLDLEPSTSNPTSQASNNNNQAKKPNSNNRGVSPKRKNKIEFNESVLKSFDSGSSKSSGGSSGANSTSGNNAQNNSGANAKNKNVNKGSASNYNANNASGGKKNQSKKGKQQHKTAPPSVGKKPVDIPLTTANTNSASTATSTTTAPPNGSKPASLTTSSDATPPSPTKRQQAAQSASPSHSPSKSVETPTHNAHSSKQLSKSDELRPVVGSTQSPNNPSTTPSHSTTTAAPIGTAQSNPGPQSQSSGPQSSSTSTKVTPSNSASTTATTQQQSVSTTSQQTASTTPTTVVAPRNSFILSQAMEEDWY